MPKTRIEKEGTVWLKWDTAPLKVYGVFYDKSCGRFLRMDKTVAKGFDDVFNNLNTRTSGGRLRFKTNSPYIGVFVKQENYIQLNNMTLCGHSGCDIYADKKYIGTFMPKTNAKAGFSDIVDTDGSWHDYTINFPLFDNVEDLYIALSDNSLVEAPEPYINEGKPIIFYGSSITQGACASRPGLSYPAVVCRNLNADYINLGFSARCLGETEMAEYINGLPKSAVVIDFDHNAPNGDYLKEHHYSFYKAVRGKDREIPIIIASAPDVSYKEGFSERREIILETVKAANESGEKVYFADGKQLFGAAVYESTVDNVHPNDLGLYNMANEFIRIFKSNNILGD